MATKPRRLKTAMQLWVVDNRKAGGWSSEDLAEWTGVTVDTARGWESRGRPSQDALDILAVKFGSQPPAESPGGGDTLTPGLSELVVALREQTAALRDATLGKQLVDAFETQAQAVMALVEEMREERKNEAKAVQARIDFAREERDRLSERVSALERDRAPQPVKEGSAASGRGGGGASPAPRRPRA